MHKQQFNLILYFYKLEYISWFLETVLVCLKWNFLHVWYENVQTIQQAMCKVWEESSIQTHFYNQLWNNYNFAKDWQNITQRLYAQNMKQPISNM